MNRSQFLKKQASKKKKRDKFHSQRARETSRMIKAENPDWSYDKTLLLGYIANGSNSLPVSKINQLKV